MGWREWLGIKAHIPATEAQLRALTSPIYRFGSYRQGISSSVQQPSALRLLTDGFSAVQATAARAIANRVADLELVVKERRRDGAGTYVTETIDDHALKAVLDTPNPLLSRRQLLKVTSYWLTQTGEAFWLIVTNGAGKTVELWPMSPSNVEKLSSDTSPVSGYVFHGEQGETPYRLEDVVWMFDPDPNDPFSGVGIVGPQARDFDAATFASATLRSHFQHDATPKAVIKADSEADAPNAEQRAQFVADWQNRYNRRSGENVGVPAFLPSGFSFQELSGLSHIDEIRAFLEYQRDQLLMANGVPRSILGDVVDANRAAAETNQFVFDRHTISPQAGLIADALTNQLARREYGPNVSVAFEEFVSGDEDLRLREEKQDLELKVRSVNDVREDRGLDPVDWGELPIGSFGDTPYDGEVSDAGPMGTGGTPFGPAPPGSEDPAQSVDKPQPADEPQPADGGRAFSIGHRIEARIQARFSPDAEHARMMQRDAVYVPRMVSAIRKVFAGQKGMVLEALPDALKTRAWQRADWLDDLFDTQDFARLWRVLVDPLRGDALHVAAEGVLAGLEVGKPLSFDVDAQKRMAEQGAQLVAYANKTTKDAIRRQLTAGLEAGDGLEAQQSRIRSVFNSASKARARTIARTEVLHAVQAGQLIGYEQSAVVEAKRWNHSRLDNERPWHLALDGAVVAVGETFNLDGEAAEAPGVGEGGGRLSARNAINCRCFMTPVL